MMNINRELQNKIVNLKQNVSETGDPQDMMNDVQQRDLMITKLNDHINILNGRINNLQKENQQMQNNADSNHQKATKTLTLNFDEVTKVM